MRTTLSLTAALVLCAAIASAQTVTSVSPTQLPRDASTEVIVRGAGLGGVSGVALGTDDVLVRSVVATDTVVRFVVGVGASTALGARSVALGGTDLVLEDALEVVPGRVSLISVAPAVVARPGVTTLDVRGTNLDTATMWSAGDGVSVLGFVRTAPTRGVLSIDVAATAFAGARDVVATSARGTSTLAAAFEVEGGAAEVSSALPAYVVRGVTTDVRLRGTNLDRVDSVSFGTRVTVSDVRVVSPVELAARVTATDDAAAGPRDATLRTDGETFATFERILSVRRGAPTVLDVRPGLVRQGDVVSVTLDGLNLDAVTSFDAGPGVTAVAIDGERPTALAVDVAVARDAPIGVRDITLTTAAGPLVLEDAWGVAPYEEPPLALRLPTELLIADVEIGALGRGGIEIENRGATPETVSLRLVAGDTDRFWLLDEAGRRESSRDVTIAGGARVLVVVEYEPPVRGRASAEVEASARGGAAPLPSVFVRSNGVRRRLELSLVQPFDFGTVPADAPARLQRLDTVLVDVADPSPPTVLAVDVQLWRDGEPFVDDAVSLEWETTSDDDTLRWGNADMIWTLEAPVGDYEGLLVFETDAPTARWVPFRFEGRVGDGGGDVEADAGGDDEGADDAEHEDADDASESDADDAGTDADASADDADDARIDGDERSDAADAGTDALSSDADNDARGGGGKSGCSAAPARPQPWALMGLGLVALVGMGRRREGHG